MINPIFKQRHLLEVRYTKLYLDTSKTFYPTVAVEINGSFTFWKMSLCDNLINNKKIAINNKKKTFFD